MAMQLATDAGSSIIPNPLSLVSPRIFELWNSVGLEGLAHFVALVYLAVAGFLAVILVLASTMSLISSLTCSNSDTNTDAYCLTYRDYESEIHAGLALGTILGGPFIILHPLLYDGIRTREYWKVDVWEKVMFPVTVVHGFIGILWRGIDAGFIFNLFSLGIVHNYKATLAISSHLPGGIGNATDSLMRLGNGTFSTLLNLPTNLQNSTGLPDLSDLPVMDLGLNVDPLSNATGTLLNNSKDEGNKIVKFGTDLVNNTALPSVPASLSSFFK